MVMRWVCWLLVACPSPTLTPPTEVPTVETGFPPPSPPPSPMPPPEWPTACGVQSQVDGSYLVDPCRSWRGLKAGQGLGYGFAAGRIGTTDLLVAGAPCVMADDNGGSCYSGIVRLDDRPFGYVTQDDLTWAEPGAEYYFGAGFGFPGDVVGTGAGLASRGQHTTYFLPTLPERRVVVSDPLGPFPSSDVVVTERDEPLGREVLPCGDVTGDGQDDLCMVGGVVQIYEGPVSDGAAAWATYPVGWRGMGVFEPGGPRIGLWLRPAPNGESGAFLVPIDPGQHDELVGEPVWVDPPGVLLGQGGDWIGDVDGDGDDDLILADKLADERAGRVVVLVDDPLAGPFGHQLTLFIGPEPYNQLGSAVHVADLDGDGHQDLVLGAPGSPLSPTVGGRVHVLPGPIAEATWSDAVTWDTPVGFDYFGKWLATFDQDGDGHLELFVGAELDRYAAEGGGAVYSIEDPLRVRTP